MEGTKPWTIKGGNAIERGWVRLWTGLYTLSFSLVLSTALFKAHKKKADTMDFGSSLLDVAYLERVEHKIFCWGGETSVQTKQSLCL